jgi:broad specificity phosphatase PhoE
MLPAKPFYMIRHGETEANAARVFAGQLDSLLTDKGREQAKLAQKSASSLVEKPSVVIHSNLSRARDTAAIINEALGLFMHEEANIAERDVGDWENCSYDIVGNSRCSHLNPPNGEHYNDFFARVKSGVTGILNSYDAPVLMVSHGGVFRALSGIYGLRLSYTTKNCHLYEFKPNPDKSPFPWDVFSYDYDEAQNRVIRIRETLYDDA